MGGGDFSNQAQHIAKDIIINIPPPQNENSDVVLITAIIGGVVAIITATIPFLLKRKKK